MQLPAPSHPLPSMYTLITMDPGLEARPPGEEMPLGMWYRDSGWVVFRTDLARSDDVQFGLKAGPHLAEKGSKGHGHPDQNGFLLNYLNEELAVDSGYYDWYGSPHHTNWTFTARAHNTLLVDGQGQRIAPPEPSFVTSFVSRRGGLDFSESEAAPAFADGLLTSWRRQVLFARPDLFLIRDVVKPAKPATLEWLLHAPKEFRIEGQAFTVRNAKAEMAGRFLAPEGLNLEQWGGFPENATPERTKFAYPDQWHLTAAPTGKAGDTVFVTVLRPGAAGKARLPEARRSVAGGTEFVTLDDPSGPIRAAFFTAGKGRAFGMAVEASALALRGDGADVLLSRATSLRDAHGVIFESSAPADVSGGMAKDGFREMVVRLDTPADIVCRTNSGLIEVNGKPVRTRMAGYNVSLSLPAGTHTIRAK